MSSRLNCTFLLLLGFTEDSHYTQEARIQIIQGHPDVVEFQANAPRPLDQVAIYMNRHLGWLLDYEDPPYNSKRELKGSVTKEWLSSGGKEYYIPNGGAFVFSTKQSNLEPKRPENSKFLDDLTFAYNATSNPGVFTVVSEPEGRFALTGSGIKNDNGFTSTITPVLNYSVTLVPKKQSSSEILKSILGQVSSSAGYPIKIASIPFALLESTEYTPASGLHPAREVLAKLLDATHVAISWSLLYDPNDRTYMLNLVGVGTYERVGAGNQQFVDGRR